MKKLFHFLFLSCDKATELVEKKLLHKLSIKEKLQLKVHMMMCDPCSTYEKQSTIIDEVLSKEKSTECSKQDVDRLKKSITEKLKDVNKK